MIDELCRFEHLYTAWQRARRATPRSLESLQFAANREEELFRLQEVLASGRYHPQGYRTFTVFEPKERLIAEAPFRDRVVHHALVALLEPVWEPGFSPASFATRKGFGTHRAIRRAQQLLKEHGWYLKLDIKSYFASVDVEVLRKLLTDRLSCQQTLEIIDRILVCDTNLPGLPIGNLTSQFFANVYLDGLDRWLGNHDKAQDFVRYMDDVVVFHEDKSSLKQLLPEIAQWLETERRLVIKPGSVRINQKKHGLSFLGMRIFSGLLRIRRQNLKRSLQALRRLTYQHERGEISFEQWHEAMTSRLAHLSHGNTLQLRHELFSNPNAKSL